jgi:hypothetical protein
MQALLANTGLPAPQAPVAEPAPVVEQVTPVAPVVVPQVAVEQPVADSWELKYRVLNGKYAAEVPRLAAEIRELKEKLTTPAPAAPLPTGLTPASVVEQYGEDFAAAVSAIADAKVDSVRQDLTTRVDAFAEDSAASKRASFISELTRYVQQWSAIDAHPGFTAYLDEFDTQTGRQRREFFNEADRANDAARVASFFIAFAQANTPPVQPQVVAAQAPSVEHLIAPDSSRHAEAPPGRKLWSRGEIQQFYADSRASGSARPYGRYTAAQYAQIDADISSAPGEGRYIG